MPSELSDVIYNEALDNKQGGTGTVALIALRSDVETCPELNAAPSTDAEYVDLADDIVFVTDAGFIKVEMVPDSSAYSSELVGPAGNKMYKKTFPFKLKGDGPAQQKLMRLLLNQDLIVLIPRADCDGTYLVLGNCCNPATLETATSNTGTSIEDEAAGNNLQLMSYAYAKVAKPTYSGAITLKPVAP